MNHMPATELHSISSPWPFVILGLDIHDTFPTGKGQVKFLVVGIDFFTRWIEVEPLTRITAQNDQKFMWKNIICSHKVPFAFVTDNGTQFTDRKIEEFCTSLGIKH